MLANDWRRVACTAPPQTSSCHWHGMPMNGLSMLTSGWRLRHVVTKQGMKLCHVTHVHNMTVNVPLDMHITRVGTTNIGCWQCCSRLGVYSRSTHLHLTSTGRKVLGTAYAGQQAYCNNSAMPAALHAAPPAYTPLSTSLNLYPLCITPEREQDSERTLHRNLLLRNSTVFSATASSDKQRGGLCINDTVAF